MCDSTRQNGLVTNWCKKDLAYLKNCKKIIDVAKINREHFEMRPAAAAAAAAAAQMLWQKYVSFSTPAFKVEV